MSHPKTTRILTKQFLTKEEVKEFIIGLLTTFDGNLQITVKTGEWNEVSCVIPVIEGYNNALQRQNNKKSES